MNIAKFISNWWKDTLDHKQRVLKDAGALRREDVTQEFFSKLREIGIYDSLQLAVSPDFGIKTRISGSNTFVSKAYSLKVPVPQYGVESISGGNFEGGLIGTLSTTSSGDISSWTLNNINPISGVQDGLLQVTSIGTLETRPRINFINSRVAGKTYKLSFDYKVNSGVCKISFISKGSTYFGATTLSGAGKFYTTFIADGTDNLQILFDGRNLFSLQLDNISEFEVLYSLDGSPVDATQTTSTSQPHLGNIIAPNERPSFKNQNGQSNFLTHPTISFAANQEWTVHTVITPFGSNAGVTSRLLGNDTASKTRIELAATGGTLFVYGETANGSIAMPNRKGKSTVLSLVYNGSGTVTAYIDGSSIGTIAVNSAFTFNTLFRASGGQNFFGAIGTPCIFSKAHTPTQIAQFANYLKVKYPEIPTVRIGNDYWATSNCEAVTTPMGNPIQNVTENGLVEKITNAADREFSSDTGFWTKPANMVIANGVCTISAGSNNNISRSNALTVGKYYKVTFTLKNKTGAGNYGIMLCADSNKTGTGIDNATVFNSNGTYTVYGKAQSTTLAIFAYGVDSTYSVDLDDISYQEIGWVGSTELYDGIYAATSGTVEQKTYAAVKAAAMWCFYNNDANLGAIYGKLYNWYAVKLLQMDIDYYNAANPSTPWGYRVPTDTDFTNAANALGGVSVAGGKMKVGGTTYFAAPNTGGDNSSGFSGLGGGRRESNGTFGSFGVSGFGWALTSGIVFYLASNSANLFVVSGESLLRGYPLRLIKS